MSYLGTSWLLFHRIWKNCFLYWDFDSKSWIVDFFTHFTHEKTPQNNYLHQNFSLENNYFCIGPYGINCQMPSDDSFPAMPIQQNVRVEFDTQSSEGIWRFIRWLKDTDHYAGSFGALYGLSRSFSFWYTYLRSFPGLTTKYVYGYVTTNIFIFSI